MLFFFSLGILILVLGAQIFLRFFNNKREYFLYLFIFSILLIFSLLFNQSYEQFQAWSQNEVSKFLLPPHLSITYFIFNIGVRFFAPYLISLAIAILFLFSANTFNKKYEERFFYPEEIWIGALSIFLSGHPGWLFYLIFIILVYLSLHLLIRSFSFLNPHYSLERLPLYYLWIPTAIFVIVISGWLQKLPLWQMLKI